MVLVRVRTFPLISRRFPLISRRFPLIFWDTTCKSRCPLIFSFSAQNLKRAKKMPRAPKSDQMEDPGLYLHILSAKSRGNQAHRACKGTCFRVLLCLSHHVGFWFVEVFVFVSGGGGGWADALFVSIQGLCLTAVILSLASTSIRF